MKVSLTILLSILIGNCTLAQDAVDLKRLDDYFTSLKDNKKFMGGVALYKNNEPIYEFYAGKSNMEANKMANYQTQYRIGSITEMFTSCLIFQLIEERKLSLDTKLSDFYPQITNSTKITISHLLNHRSGLRNYMVEKKILSQNDRVWRKGDLMAMLVNLPIDHQPNEKISYSIANYLLLGFIIERLRGESYSVVLDKLICKPLMLTSTRYGGEINTNMHGAYSYRFTNEDWVKIDETNMSIVRGAGAISSSPRDLNTFIQSLYRHRLINESSLDSMLSIDNGFGRGIIQYQYDDKIAWGSGGHIDGFQSHVCYLPNDSLSISIIGNAMNYSLNEILTTTLDVYYERNVNFPNFSNQLDTVSKEVLLVLEGNYRSETYPETISLILKDNTLYAQSKGHMTYPLTAYENASFRFDPVGIEIKFSISEEKIEDGGFVLYQRGVTFQFKKE